VRDIVKNADSISLCLSKGLGAPVGSVLAGSKELIRRAYRVRKLVGGGLRQAGLLAAAGIYALDHHVERLADDHANAIRLAEQLATIPQISVDVDAVQTNMVFMNVAQDAAASLPEYLQKKGILINGHPSRIRLVTHLDVHAEQIDQFVTELRGFFA
jgi:threonine aldolase